MNRFASGPWKHGFGFRPPVNIDSAPQSFVTVCMIFSCSPESCGQAPSDSSAADPFPFGSCLALPDRTDEHRTSISSDSLCRYPIIPFPGCQPETPQASIFCYIRQDSQSEMLFFGDSVQFRLLPGSFFRARQEKHSAPYHDTAGAHIGSGSPYQTSMRGAESFVRGITYTSAQRQKSVVGRSRLSFFSRIVNS